MGKRESKEVGGAKKVAKNKREAAQLEAKNAYEQRIRLEQLIDEAVDGDRFALRPSTIQELNRLAVDGLVEMPGRYRLGVMEIDHSNHVPPAADDVAREFERLCDYVNGEWSKTAVHLAAYAMWRTNWIHGFQNGNGRTARAVAYLVLCARLEAVLPGDRTIPSQIVDLEPEYITGLEDADAAYAGGRIDVSLLEALIRDTLVEQILAAATSEHSRESIPRAEGALEKSSDSLERAGTATPAVRSGWSSPKVMVSLLGAVVVATGGIVAAVISNCGG